MNNIETIEHIADIGMKVKAGSIKTLFNTAAKGIISLALRRINKEFRQKEKIKIKLKKDSIEELLHDFLNEIIYLVFVKKKYVSEITIKKLSVRKKILTAEAGVFTGIRAGQYILRELKSVTFHGLRVEKGTVNYETAVIIDT